MWHKQVENVYLNQAPVTPLVPVRRDPDGPVIWCKLEFLNPSGSTKDRIANYILGKALRQGRLAEGQTVIEASSGSTSIAMALACAQFGLHFVAVMPEGVSAERVMIIRAYGGEVVMTLREEGIHGSISRAEALAEERSAFLPRQFSNPDNAEAHRRQTAQEIMNQIPSGQVDAVVSGVGTGGTLVGLLEGFHDHGCETRPFYARPVHGTALRDAECCSFSPCIPGVMEGLSEIFRGADLSGLKTIEVEDRAALEAARCLMRSGFPVGASSGLNFLAAQEAARQLGAEATVVTVFPDRMERYFSTELFHPVD